MPTAELLLAVDAGGTKTAAWLVDTPLPIEDAVLGAGRSTAGNPLSVGIDESARAINEAVEQARSAAGLANDRVARAILSVAGAANSAVSARFIDWSRGVRLAERVAIVSDVLPVLAAGTPECCGVALVAGTGSVAFARGSNGATVLCGGWGYLLGDEGSGFAIGRDALKLVLHSLEARSMPKPLVESILKSLNAKAVTEITSKIYSHTDTRRAIAAVAPRVIEAAEAGDADAQQIVDSAAEALSRLVKRAVEAVNLVERPLSLALSGGVLKGSRRLQEQLAVELRRHGLECEMNVVDEPLTGCVRLATGAGDLVQWHDV